jgi:hypothetical protein
MSRVTIEGQFDPSNPYVSCSAKQPFRVSREDLPFNQQPSNWDSFCDEVDRIIQKLNKPRQQYKYSSILFSVMLAGFFLPSITSQRKFANDDDPSLFIMYMVSMVISVFMYTYLWVKINLVLKQVFSDVGQLCSQSSVPNSVTYELHDEWWGKCSKVTSRRRFLIIKTSFNDNDDITNDVERQRTSGNRNIIQAETNVNTSNNITANFSTMQQTQFMYESDRDRVIGSSTPSTTSGKCSSMFSEMSSTITR